MLSLVKIGKIENGKINSQDESFELIQFLSHCTRVCTHTHTTATPMTYDIRMDENR